MKHKLITLLLAIVASIGTIFAQDIIITQDAERIDCTITEVSETEVKYKRADNPSGPVFTLSTSKISSIIYKNGTVQTFENKQEQTQQQPQIYSAMPEYDIWGDPDYSSVFGRMNVNKIQFVSGQQMKYKNNRYIYGNVVMDAAIYKAFLQRYCMPAYNEFCAAKTMGEVGSVFSSIGLGIVLGGALALALWPYSKKDPNWIAVGTVMGFGGASLIVGIPLVCVGWKNEEKTINTFNNSCANNKLSLQLNVNNDGLGLALNF